MKLTIPPGKNLLQPQNLMWEGTEKEEEILSGLTLCAKLNKELFFVAKRDIFQDLRKHNETNFFFF